MFRGVREERGERKTPEKSVGITCELLKEMRGDTKISINRNYRTNDIK